MKIFGIGLSRTGTTSLVEALRVLGYSAVHYPRSLEDIRRHEAAADVPVAVEYKLLDRLFPGSCFIYTTREISSWLASCEHYWHGHPVYDEQQRDVRLRLFGRLDFDARDFRRGYRAHHQDVMRYFSKRPGDLLVMNICAGDGWAKLSNFLKKGAPPCPFPCSNRSAYS